MQTYFAHINRPSHYLFSDVGVAAQILTNDTVLNSHRTPNPVNSLAIIIHPLTLSIDITEMQFISSECVPINQIRSSKAYCDLSYEITIAVQVLLHWL